LRVEGDRFRVQGLWGRQHGEESLGQYGWRFNSRHVLRLSCHLSLHYSTNPDPHMRKDNNLNRSFPHEIVDVKTAFTTQSAETKYRGTSPIKKIPLP
jgi:hypothetical protein